MRRVAWLLGLVFLLAGCMAAPVSPQSTPTTGQVAAERGKVLFRNKGCVACHVNTRVDGKSGVVTVGAPDLSNYAQDPAFLRRWLANPASVRPGTRMPNLQLSGAEIDDLIAFLDQLG